MAGNSKDSKILAYKDMINQLNKTIAAQTELIQSLQKTLETEYSCVMKSHFWKFGNQNSGTRKSPILCLMTYPFLLGYLSRPCRICGA